MPMSQSPTNSDFVGKLGSFPIVVNHMCSHPIRSEAASSLHAMSRARQTAGHPFQRLEKLTIQTSANEMQIL